MSNNTSAGQQTATTTSKARSFFFTAFAPHLALTPLALLARLASWWNPPSLLSWVPAAAWLVLIAALVAAWVASSLAAGRRLVGFGWLTVLGAPLASLREYLGRRTVVRRDDEDAPAAIAGIALAFILGTCLLGAIVTVWNSALLFALVVQVVDLAVLGAALHRSGVLAALLPSAEEKARSLPGRIQKVVAEIEEAKQAINALPDLDEATKQTMIASLETRREDQLARLTEESHAHPVGAREDKEEAGLRADEGA